ncbi:MAG: SDR family NAD(P)-dependent oxidoreductase [Spirochaetales bacterium]|nr:SDR family NAD(P)-dependent oxidoreductase [Spirochaetales bacterium]
MALIRYLIQYRFRDMGELIRNDKKDPLECSRSLEGKTIVLSGATSGIGLETARLFAEKGASLICLNRNPDKSENLEKELKDKFNCDLQTIIVDFSSTAQVKNCAETLLKMEKPIDILIHNSGVFNTTKQWTEDNIESVFQVNHLGSFLLNYMLKEKLKRENRARIIYVNSEGHRFALAGVHLKDLNWRWHLYTGLKSYGAAKTAQLLTMQKFKEFFSDCNVTINAMHPGNVKSDMGNNNGKLYRMMKKKLILSSAKEPAISAKALYYLAASDKIEGFSGKFFNLTTEEKPAPHARDYSAVEGVWKKSLELCGLL